MKQIHFLADDQKICLFKKLGLKPKKICYIQMKDKNGIPLDKFLKVVEGSQIHEKLLNCGVKLEF